VDPRTLESSNPVFRIKRTMALSTLYILPGYLILTAGCSLLALIVALFDSSGDRSHRVAVLWAGLILFISRVKIEVKNLRPLEPGCSYIFAANHQSAFDILVLLARLPVPFRWLSKESYFKIPLFGWAMKRAGYIPINRSNPKQAYQSLLVAAQKVQQGTSVVIFPEGTRQSGDHLGAFKKGGGILSIKSQQPIVPVSILGSGRVKAKKGFRITPGTIKVVLGEPIPTKGYKIKDAEKVMEKVRQAIKENLNQNKLKAQSPTAATE
jgi:1-acyl-sn-glycerol-3-phosphate acyltransferase